MKDGLLVKDKSASDKVLRQCDAGRLNLGRAALVQTHLQLVCYPQQYKPGLQGSCWAKYVDRWKRCRQERGKKEGKLCL